MPSSTAEAAGKPGFQERDVERPSSHKWLITIAIMLGATLEVLDTSIVNVSLPHMQGAFSASIDEITWVVTSYYRRQRNHDSVNRLDFLAARPQALFSHLGRRFRGSIRTMWCGYIAQADGYFPAYSGRRRCSNDSFVASDFDGDLPTTGTATCHVDVGAGPASTSPMLGPTLGGWITYNWNWRWNFYINLPIGIMALIMVYIFVQDPDYMRKARTTARRVDYFGIACLVVGLGLFQIVLDRGQRADWFATTWVRIFTAVAASALILLVIRELRFREPILDLSILKIPQFDISVVILMSMSLITWGMNA